MPPIRRSNLGKRTRNATNQANYRSNSQTREARASLNRAAFSYDVSIDYSNYQCVVIGSMNSVCSHCKALKYKNEANGLCCANGKVKLIPLDPPPEPLYSLVSGIGTDSIHFLTNIQQYNNCFQMTSFGATNVVRENFMPTFKIQGQIYHRAGSLLPVSDSDNKFLQIYFMGNSPQEIDLRCAHNNLVKRSIVEQLQTLFHQHNQLIILFKTALDLMPSDNHKIVIRADKTPAGQHTRRFNAPTIDEVAIVVVGENLESRDIKILNIKHVKVLHLSKNMRVELQNDQSGNIFSKQLIDIGNGKFPIDMLTGCINFPLSFCQLTRSKDELIQKVFPDVSQNYRNHDWLSERAILAAKNIDVNELNFKIQEQITGELMIYKSVDSATNQDDVVNYPPEFLNSLDLAGLPPHNLQLKVGSVVIMLRNINQPRLCNGTRLAIKKLLNNVIEATILKGKYKGEDVLIPRIPMIPTDVPFEFKRLQFPVRLAFAMTINKSQGQSLSVCGINLENPCFSHGQLYVACSRVGKPSDLFIYAPGNQTRNIVYHKVLQ
ncbi:uncharacterized protein LOC126550363 [Aphis gossypii]|uniref:uncharacterized protein LOC126550363 n=1 Tax=Aphis gossypii TaxID=80765 RepID=UPI0021592B03|nr:uncharacterized protein LOC126550363 [Aphis gossypii]